MMIFKFDVNFIIFYLINLMKYLFLVVFGLFFVKIVFLKFVLLILCFKENYYRLIMVVFLYFLINFFFLKRLILVIIFFLN